MEDRKAELAESEKLRIENCETKACPILTCNYTTDYADDKYGWIIDRAGNHQTDLIKHPDEALCGFINCEVSARREELTEIVFGL